MKKLSIGLIISIIIASITYSQEAPKFITDTLEIYVNRALENWKIPGAALLVIKDGKIIVAKGFGVREFGTDDRVDDNTLFMIGSNTKAFTGTALALLEHKGKLKLEDKVVKYLPDFKMKDKWITKELNLVDIITHRMGFETFQGDFMYWTSDLSEDEVIERLGLITPKFNFRTKYGYTNAGYAIAGKVIEKVSGLRWDEYLRENIFKPLGMNRTVGLSVDFSRSDNVAKPHTIVNNELKVLSFENIDNMAPCGSMGSSISDMSHWLIAQLDSGKYNGESVIPFKVIQRTRQPETIQGRSRHPFNTTHFNLYGLGWGLMDYEGTEIVSHTGGVNGFVTSVTLLPEINLGIVVLTNTDQNGFFNMLKWEIVDSYLGLPYRNYDGYIFDKAKMQNEQREQQISVWRDSVSMHISSDLNLSDIAGRYEHDVYGYADLLREDDYLMMTLQHHSNVKGKLEYMGSNRFLCTYSDPLFGIKVFPFEIENGVVKSFDLYVDDFIDFQPYTFIKK